MTAIARRVDSTLVALTPQDVAPAQMNLAAWCRGKLSSSSGGSTTTTPAGSSSRRPGGRSSFLIEFTRR